MASLSEKRANTAILQANSEKEEAIKKKSEYDKLIASQKKLTEKRAEQLNDKFRKQWQWVMLVLIAYGGLATLFTGYKSERVVSDCIAAFNAIRNVIMIFFNGVNDILAQIAGSNGILKTIVVIISVVVVFGIIGLILFFGGRAIVRFYQDFCFDEISLFVVVVTVAVLVWFAEVMPLNIILILILSHILYIVVRWYVKGYKENH